jgi:hypothetical protein
MLPSTVSAETVTPATATLSVTVPRMPLAAVVQPGREFVVAASTKKAYCTVTLIVADPTLMNKGWRVSLGVSSFSNACGEAWSRTR